MKCYEDGLLYDLINNSEIIILDPNLNTAMHFNFEIKDIITLLSVTATLLVSIWSLTVNLRNTKKTLFINTVTSSRIKFIECFRNSVAEYCGAVLHLLITDMDEGADRPLLEKIDRLTYQIKLQLNPHDIYDKKIIQNLENIEMLLDEETDYDIPQKDFENLIQKELDRLVSLSQVFLKLEWEGVKKESMKGEISKEEKTALVKRYLGR